MQQKPTGTVLYRQGKGSSSEVVYAVAKWRDSTRQQQYRRLGKAWVERDSSGEWRKRRGNPPDGYLEPRSAERLLDALVSEVEAAIGKAKTDHKATFAELVPGYLDYAEHTQRVKPSTLREYARLLKSPTPRKRQEGDHLARIIREFGSKPMAKITTGDIEKFLRRLDREGVKARNVNLHRQVLVNVFEYACREDALALPGNPASATQKRREEYAKVPSTFSVEEVLAISRAAAAGRHRPQSPQSGRTQEEIAELRRMDEQDAALYVVAALSGLRQGELRALRWKQIRFEDRTLLVVAGMSAGKETSTKSGKWRPVPIATDALLALEGLSRRDRFTGPEDLVFCGAAGGPLDESALRKRYTRARDVAGAQKLSFHHLRHTFATLAIRGLDPATVQSLMGHSKITTTERYMHARPLTELAGRMDTIFGSGAGAVVTDEPATAEVA